ncbi:MAG TPA: hypothetical protein EYN51_11645 [Flavobacteriales bacterium]|nr:hypothetical protein [Flavobacteriales bacterium]
MKLKIYQPKLYLILFVSSLFLFSTGCKKYDDGPLISLKSKKSRITNTWILDEVFENGIEVLSPMGIPSGEIFGVYCNEVAIIDNNNATFKFVDLIIAEGNWQLINNKSKIEFNLKNGKIIHWDILKLKTKELWVQENDFEYRLRPK